MDLLRIASRIASPRVASVAVEVSEEKEVFRDDKKTVVEVSGMDDTGMPFSGVITIYTDGGQANGWDWAPASGSVPADPDSVQAILDSVGDTYGM